LALHELRREGERIALEIVRGAFEETRAETSNAEGG
jgi:hypothetical protein